MIKTEKQQAYHQRRCTYCRGTGIDLFNNEFPCPNCSKVEVLMDKKENVNQIKFDVNGDFVDPVDEKIFAESRGWC